MKTAAAALLIFGITCVTATIQQEVRLVVKQHSSLKRTNPTKFEVFATRRLAFLKSVGDTFRIRQPGISGTEGTISLESKRLPGFYLKQHGYKFLVNEEDSDDNFGPLSQGQGKLSSFVQLRRENVPGAAFFELEDRPGWFICHESPPKLILRAREINRTPNFDDRCSFFIEQVNSYGENTTNRSTSDIKPSPKALSNRTSKTGKAKGNTLQSRGKQMSQNADVRNVKNSSGSVQENHVVISKVVQGQNDRRLKLRNRKLTNSTSTSRMVNKHKEADVDAKKDSSIGLPILFSTVGINMGKFTTKSGNESTIPVTEVLDPHASAHDSDSMMALHADKIIEDLEKNEIREQEKPKVVTSSNDQIHNPNEGADYNAGGPEPAMENVQATQFPDYGLPLPIGHPNYQDEMHLVQEQREQRVQRVQKEQKEERKQEANLVQEDDERQKLISHLIDVDKDKCLSIVFHNKIGKRYKLMSSFNPRGYRPKGIEFSLKAIFKEYRKKDTVIFKAVDDKSPAKALLLNGNKELFVDLGNCVGVPFSVDVTSPEWTDRRVMDDISPN